MPEMEIYTDGACLSNPDGPGGWSFVALRDGAVVAERVGHERETTNNRMELTAVIEAARWVLAEGIAGPVVIHTDSQYVERGVNAWIEMWRSKGWRNASGKVVANFDLWVTLAPLLERAPFELRWVRGHDGNRWNERADALANGAARAPMAA